MGAAGIDLEFGVWDEFHRLMSGGTDGDNLVVIPVDDESRHIEPLQIFCEIRLGESLDAVIRVLVPGHHPLRPPGLDQALRNLGPRTVEAEEGTAGHVQEELRPVSQIGLAEAVKHLHGQTAGTGLCLEHDRWHRSHEHSLGNPCRAMAADVAGHFPAACRVTDHHHVSQVQQLKQLRHIVSILVHVIAIPRLAGTSMPAAVVRDTAKSMGCEEKHLRLPRVRTERPAVTEGDDRPFAPVLVVDFRAVFGDELAHGGWMD